MSPVLAATAVAAHDGAGRPLAGIGALVVAIALQVGVNYANDYSDFVRGADRRRVGPLRAASSGIVPPAQVRTAAQAAFFGVVGPVGLALCLATDPRLLLFGALAVLAGWLYTGGPRPYGYLGLGELFVFVFFGLMAAAGTAYVRELRVPPAAWTAGVATGCLACAILALNNLRDIETDAGAGKRTLAVRLGRRGTRALIDVLFVVALAAPVFAALLGWAPWPVVLTLATGPMVVAIRRSAASGQPPELVRALKRTAVLEVWWALLWTVGFLL